MSNASVHLEDKQIDKYLQAHPSELLLIDFYASWCPHCQMVGPILEDLARKYHGKKVEVIKIDADEAENAATKYQVEVLPTIIMYRNGEILERHEGSNDRRFFENLITKYL
jgi:thioredoxin 1